MLPAHPRVCHVGPSGVHPPAAHQTPEPLQKAVQIVTVTHILSQEPTNWRQYESGDAVPGYMGGSTTYHFAAKAKHRTTRATCARLCCGRKSRATLQICVAEQTIDANATGRYVYCGRRCVQSAAASYALPLTQPWSVPVLLLGPVIQVVN